ncbi:MAG: hypothetical protein AUI16_13995 [Alphaproteobacteria bacterium 13_2_20CM_2_64_7]|jgi:hypothetical protein|nr:MAG: hypothetical protein AUI16_13995 [Alphaproteobacteria bacterium 13_2_20CM_2_64_7]
MTTTGKNRIMIFGPKLMAPTLSNLGRPRARRWRSRSPEQRRQLSDQERMLTGARLGHSSLWARAYDHHSYMEEKKAAMKGRKWKIAIRLAVLSSIWLLHVAFLAVFKFSLL